MKTLFLHRNLIVSIFVVMLLMYGVQGISYGQENAPTVTPGEINTTLVVSFLTDDVSAYQIQLRKKAPQGDWITACVVAIGSGIGSGGGPSTLPLIGIFFRPSIGGGGTARARFVFTNLEPGTTYEARYRNTNLDECNENPPDPDPWSAIGDGTTHLVTPPRIEFVDANLAKAVRRTLKLFYTQGPHIELLKIPEAALVKLTELDASIGVDSMGVPKIPGLVRPEIGLPESVLAHQTEVQDSIAAIRGTKIVNLTGLEHASQLTKLLLGRNQISDINPIAELTQLTELNLENNEISDITSLAELTQLTELYLEGNQIIDIGPLAQLTPTVLGLNNNKIRDIMPLSQWTQWGQLTELHLTHNQIVDVTPLAQLAGSSVTELDLSNNQIVDVTPLAQLAGSLVTELDLSHNRIVDVTPLTQLAGSSVIELDLRNNQIADVTPLTQLAGSSVTELDLRNNQIRDVAPLAVLIQLKRLSVRDNPIENTFPLRALLDTNPDLRIDITISKEEVPTLSVSTHQPLTGVMLDGAIVKLTLSSGTFDRVGIVVKDPFTISGIPGIGVVNWSEIEYVSNTEIEIKLTFNGDNITTDSLLTLTVGPDAIANYNGPAYTLQIPVTAASETELAELSKALVASTTHPLTAATLNGSIITLKLTNGIYEKSRYDISGAVKVSGIQGVTFGVHEDHGNGRWDANDVKRVSDSEITFELAFSGTLNANATLTFTVESGAIAGYNGPARTTKISVSASTEVEITGELIASTAFPLTPATLNGSIVKLTLQDSSYSYKGDSYVYDKPTIGITGIPGIKTARLRSGSYLWKLNSTQIWVKIFFNGDLDTDTTLTFTVPPGIIKGYSGPPLTTTLPVTVKKGRQVLVSERSRPSMYWISMDTDKIESLDPFDAVTNQAASLTVDTADGKVYWSEHSSSGGVIKRANLDGTNVEMFVTRPITPQSIRVDPTGKKLYWINSLAGKIQSADLSDGNIKTIIQLDDTITHIAVDTKERKLYWADSEFRIRRMNLDGTGIETLLTGWNSYLPRGIGGMVIADGKIYWTERQIWYQVGGKIQRANLNGTNLETLAISLGEPVGIAVDTVGGKVYWTNSYGGIQRIDINGGEIENVVYGIVAPEDFVLIPSGQPATPTTATINTTVSISPVSVTSPAVGEQLEFSLKIAGGEAVAGYQATVQFDTTALGYVSGANGDYLPAGAFFVEPKLEGNLVKLNAVSLAGESNGNGTLATLTFEVIAVKRSTLTLSDVLLTNSAGMAFVPTIENAQITETTQLKGDINGDGVINIQDLVLTASNLGKIGQNPADVNGDGSVNIVDLVLVAGALGTSAAAPSLHVQSLETFTAAEVKLWLSQAQQLYLMDIISQRGILYLEQLLTVLIPKETALLTNYPNPFNPETWIPYHLAKDADVTLHIYAVNGTLVRTLTLGHQPAGLYQSRSRAAYWNGRNALGEPVASGLYFYTLTAGDFSATRKMLIRK